ncbi:MAG: AtpZ/AtpI family protein [Pseudomonadota bacterium]
MTDPDDKERLEALQARLDEIREAQAPKPRTSDHHSQAQLAWRMVIELVAGLGIGFGMGYGLDALLGTSPWLMIVFVFLGFAAGIQTMMRSAKEVQEKQQAADAAEDDGPHGP